MAGKSKLIKRISIIAIFILTILSLYYITRNYNQKKEINNAVAFNLPAYSIQQSTSNGDLWDYTSCYIIKFSNPVSQEFINSIKFNLIEIKENYSFTFTRTVNARDTVHYNRLRRRLGLPVNEKPKKLCGIYLNIYGECKEQLDPQKLVYFGINIEEKTAVIKIIHM